MRFLLDMPVSPALAEWLRSKGHDAVHATERGLHREPDRGLLRLARDEDRVVVTADLDFPRLLALSHATGPGVVLFRGGNYSDAEMIALMEQVLRQVRPEDMVRAIVVVDRNRVRVTRLPLRP